MKKENKVKSKKMSKTNIAWTIALSLLSGLIFGLSFLLYSSYSTSSYLSSTLESTYQKSYYDLTDKVNNMEVKLGKVLASSDSNYSAKVLAEISKNAEDAQSNLNVLPVSLNGVEESLSFINKVGGYTGTLSKQILDGNQLSQTDEEMLKKLHTSILKMKQTLNKVSEEMWNGYSILDDSLSIEGDYNNFTVTLQSLTAGDVEYPTMIYDGPFSDSQIDTEPEGLKGEEVSLSEAENKLAKLMEINSGKITIDAEANSSFKTYNFSFEKSNISYYAQISKIGGHLITLASYNDSDTQTVSKPEAQEIAKEFVAKNGIEEVECVWSDVVGKDAFFNFAPVINEVIIYPDLIKVKVDLAHGEVIGYEAKSYFTNNKDRNLEDFSITSSQASGQVKGNFSISSQKKALAPIDFQEILCWEFKALSEGNVYYFYVDGQAGRLVNVLRVIQTTDGSKLM